MTAAPGLYLLQPIHPAADPRLFGGYNDDAVLVPIPVQRTEEPRQLRVVEQ